MNINHSIIEKNSIKNLNYRNMTPSQKKIATREVMYLYFYSDDNTPAAITKKLEYRKSVAAYIISLYIIPGANLKLLKTQFSSPQIMK